jgi:myosin-crossreactive antigen
MKIKFISSFVVSLIVFLLVLVPIVNAADEVSLSATVTVQNISVTVTDGSITYGTLSTSGTANTTATGVDDSQTATNNGNVTEDFDIKGADTAAWSLAGSAGSENYAHNFCTSDCDGDPSWTALTTSYQALATSVSTSGTQEFDLRINVPTSTSTYTEQTAQVWVLASAS